MKGIPRWIVTVEIVTWTVLVSTAVMMAVAPTDDENIEPMPMPLAVSVASVVGRVLLLTQWYYRQIRARIHVGWILAGVEAVRLVRFVAGRGPFWTNPDEYFERLQLHEDSRAERFL